MEKVKKKKKIKCNKKLQYCLYINVIFFHRHQKTKLSLDHCLTEAAVGKQLTLNCNDRGISNKCDNDI